MDFKADIENLVERVKKKDVDAFGEVFDLFLTPIFRFVFFRLGHQQDAEDLTEEIFLKSWKNISFYQKKVNIPFSAWLFQIAKNTITDFYRQKNKKNTISLNENEIDKKSENNVFKKTENDFDKKRIVQALKKIPPLQADAVTLKFFCELSNQEIAQILKKSETAVRILQSRGLKKLKEIINETS